MKRDLRRGGGGRSGGRSGKGKSGTRGSGIGGRYTSYRSTLFIVGPYGRRGVGNDTTTESGRHPNKPSIALLLIMIFGDIAILFTCCAFIRCYCKPCCCYSKKTKKDVGENDGNAPGVKMQDMTSNEVGESESESV